MAFLCAEGAWRIKIFQRTGQLQNSQPNFSTKTTLNLRAVRSLVRGVRVPFRRWLSRACGVRGVRSWKKSAVARETPYSTFPRKQPKIFAPCAHLLGASKCFYKSGFPVRGGRVAYLSYASGLRVQGNALREVLSRPVKGRSQALQ